MMRTFIAIDLPLEVRSEIKMMQKTLFEKGFFTGKLTEIENLHLTLKFLGEISEDKIIEIKKRLFDIKFDKFHCELGEIGVFSKDFIRIIWIKLNGNGLFDLQKEIDKSLFDLFPIEVRFMGHITIARVKKVRDKKKLLECLYGIKSKKMKFLVNDFILKKSELSGRGPVYTDIERYKLVGEKI